MQRLFIGTAAAAIVAGIGTLGAQAQQPPAPEERREVAEHVHGESVLRIAVDGNLMALDFDVPGLDVLGFEHEPTTPEDLATVDATTAKLEDILSLFDFGADAGCSVTSAEVALLVEEEHEDEPAAAAAAAPAPAGGAEEITNHVGFEGVYEVTCSNPGAIRELTLNFFNEFEGAEVVEIELATARGQTTLDVERPTTTVPLAGLI